MNQTLVMLAVMLSNQGHWFGGVEETATFRWNNAADVSRTVVLWQVLHEDVVLKSGRLDPPGEGRTIKLAMTLPEVRVRTALRLAYRLETTDGKQVLAKGESPLYVYPADPLDGVGKRLGKKRLVVWDDADGIPAALARAKVPYVRIDDESRLVFSGASIVLVGEDRIRDLPFAQSTLFDAVRGGAGVVVFRQTKPARLDGYSLVRRAAPEKLRWRKDHPLYRSLSLRDPSGTAAELWAIRLPADEPALELAYWPRQQPGKQPVPVDAVAAVKTLGKGRIVFCQIPMGSWTRDPRAQMFLNDAIDYLASPVEPTLPPSRRVPARGAKGLSNLSKMSLVSQR